MSSPLEYSGHPLTSWIKSASNRGQDFLVSASVSRREIIGSVVEKKTILRASLICSHSSSLVHIGTSYGKGEKGGEVTTTTRPQTLPSREARTRAGIIITIRGMEMIIQNKSIPTTARILSSFSARD